MKKMIFMIFVLGFMFSGCSNSITQSEFWQHPTHYKNWEHTVYSWSGYKNPTKETGEESDSQNWWGIPVEGKK